MFTYLARHKKLLRQLVLGLFLGSFFQLIFPFLTQAIVDVGITTGNLGFIKLVLLAQVALFAGQMSVEFLRGWIMLHIGTRVNIALVSDFLIKLMKLPVRFFDSKLTGDLLQRINDNHRVEQFLTSSTLSTLFSMINFIVFGVVLAFFNTTIFLIYAAFTVLYISWVTLFLKKRKELDYKRFDQMSLNQSSLIQLIYGMQEIKLHNAEKQKRWEWERIQAKLYRVSISYFGFGAISTGGGVFFQRI